MATILPLKGLRPTKDLVDKVASKPYDVLNSDEARVEAKGNSYSFLHVVKPEIDLPPTVDLYDDKVYKKGKDNLQKFIDEGVLIREKKECFYLYRLNWKQVSQIGLVGLASVTEYENDTIKKHEKTRADKEKDRVKHVKTQNANAGPIFLTYRQSNRIDSLLIEEIQKTPLYDFSCGDSVQHTIWKIDDKDKIEKLVDEFKGIKNLYVADGHHRSASAAIVGRQKREANPNHTGNESYNFFLSVLFPHDELFIMDYNRVVKDLNGLNISEFLEKLSKNFHIEKVNKEFKPKTPHTFGMYLNGSWYSLIIKKGVIPSNDPKGNLDTSLLQNLVLEEILGIDDPRTDKRIDFVGGIRGLQELKKRVDKDSAVSFALFPTSVQQLMAIADAGEIMPPKSTWFEPKLRSGIIVNILD